MLSNEIIHTELWAGVIRARTGKRAVNLGVFFVVRKIVCYALHKTFMNAQEIPLDTAT